METNENHLLKIPFITELLQHPEYQFLQQDRFSLDDDFWMLDSPLEYTGMTNCIALLEEMIESKGGILIVGDKDADGMISVAMLMQYLAKRKCLNVDFMIPNLHNDYGLTGDFLGQLQEKEFEYLIILDMGVSFLEEIKSLYDSSNRKPGLCQIRGILIIDHHQIPQETLSDWQDIAHNKIILLHPYFRLHASTVNTATAGLIFKLLLASALYQTEEKNRVYLCEDQYYHCGKKIDSIETVKSYTEYPISLEKLCPSFNKIVGREISQIEIGKIILHQSVQSRENLRQFVLEFAELASLAILADMMPLDGDNRKIVRIALPQMSGLQSNNNKGNRDRFFNIGLNTLCERLSLKYQYLSRRDFVWSIIPYINAAGRMGEGYLAVQLLTYNVQSKTTVDLKKIIKKIMNLNKMRKKNTLENEKLIEQLDYPERIENERIFFAYHPDLIPGLSGLLANRLAEKYQKIVILVTPNGKNARGSARCGWAENSLDLREFLLLLEDILIQMGGHRNACGFSVVPDRIPELKERLMSDEVNNFLEARLQKFEGNEKSKTDPMMAGSSSHLLLTSAIDFRLYRALSLLEPFGQGNPEPLILLKAVQMKSIYFFKDDQHMSFKIDGSKLKLYCYLWNHATVFLQKYRKELVEEKSDQSASPRNYFALGSLVNLVGYLQNSYFGGRFQYRFLIKKIVLTDKTATTRD